MLLSILLFPINAIIHTYIFDERNHHLVSQVGDLAEPQAYFLQARFLPLGVALGYYESAGIQGVDVGKGPAHRKGTSIIPSMCIC